MLTFSVSECTFGKQIRELGSTWFADLGPPFGVMYCIKCECVPVRDSFFPILKILTKKKSKIVSPLY